jgi:hypothetical protein
LMCAQILGAPQLIGADESNGRFRRGARGWLNTKASGFGIVRIARSAVSKNLMIAIFLEAWLQSSPRPNRRDSRQRILIQFEAINQVADALRRAAPFTHLEARGQSDDDRELALVNVDNGSRGARSEKTQIQKKQ